MCAGCVCVVCGCMSVLCGVVCVTGFLAGQTTLSSPLAYPCPSLLPCYPPFILSLMILFICVWKRTSHVDVFVVCVCVYVRGGGGGEGGGEGERKREREKEREKFRKRESPEG